MKKSILFVCLIFGLLISTISLQAETKSEAIKKAVSFLSLSQLPDGSFVPGGVGSSAIILTGLIRNGISPDDPLVAPGIDYLLAHQQPGGEISSPGSRHACYETSIAICCLVEAKSITKSDRFDNALFVAEKYLRSMQYSEENETELGDTYYGGLGYGNKTRPDLSNTQFFLDALDSLDIPSDAPAIQRALVFVKRCQSYKSELEYQALQIDEPDGGFFYTCAEGGESKAGQNEGGALRSYGSMTYAGLKSLIHAGLTADDPRVKAATQWIRNNYTLDSNPGMGLSGLYYYYHTMAKSFDIMGDEQFTDADGTTHVWKTELLNKMIELQHPEGYWVNTDHRWMENDPCLVTGYILLVLSYCD